MRFPEINTSQICFWLKGISDWKLSFQDQGVIILQKRTCGTFFQFFMLNISSIKELLYKPSEIQWNVTGTQPRKLKRKISWALSYKISLPEITKMWEIAISEVLWGPGNQCEIQCFFMILWISESFCLYLLVKNSLTLN